MDRRGVRTRIYSQFSEVRFSSVALAAAEETGQHLRKGQGRYIGRHSPTASSNAFCWARNIAGVFPGAHFTQEQLVAPRFFRRTKMPTRLAQ
jgi:hypothetical protein